MSYGQYNQNPYHQGPAQEAGDGYQQQIPYGQGQYEMTDYNAQAQSSALSKNPFLDRVKSIRDEIEDIQRDLKVIGTLQSQTFGPDDSRAKELLEQQTTRTQSRNTAAKDQIKDLELDLAKTTDATLRSIKQKQIENLKKTFKDELDEFSRIERAYELECRKLIARQYRIVNPGASEDEVKQASEADWGNEGVFQTALRTSQTGQASSLLGNVRARHNELHRIEQTLSELALLYQELATVVEQQEPVIQAAENNAINTTENMEKGIQETDKAKISAARARKLKWWLALVVLLIVLAIALGVGLGIGLVKNATSK